MSGAPFVLPLGAVVLALRPSENDPDRKWYAEVLVGIPAPGVMMDTLKVTGQSLADVEGHPHEVLSFIGVGHQPGCAIESLYRALEEDPDVSTFWIGVPESALAHPEEDAHREIEHADALQEDYDRTIEADA